LATDKSYETKKKGFTNNQKLLTNETKLDKDVLSEEIKGKKGKKEKIEKESKGESKSERKKRRWRKGKGEK